MRAGSSGIVANNDNVAGGDGAIEFAQPKKAT